MKHLLYRIIGDCNSGVFAQRRGSNTSGCNESCSEKYHL